MGNLYIIVKSLVIMSAISTFVACGSKTDKNLELIEDLSVYKIHGKFTSDDTVLQSKSSVCPSNGAKEFDVRIRPGQEYNIETIAKRVNGSYETSALNVQVQKSEYTKNDFPKVAKYNAQYKYSNPNRTSNPISLNCTVYFHKHTHPSSHCDSSVEWTVDPNAPKESTPIKLKECSIISGKKLLVSKQMGHFQFGNNPESVRAVLTKHTESGLISCENVKPFNGYKETVTIQTPDIPSLENYYSCDNDMTVYSLESFFEESSKKLIDIKKKELRSFVP